MIEHHAPVIGLISASVAPFSGMGTDGHGHGWPRPRMATATDGHGHGHVYGQDQFRDTSQLGASPTALNLIQLPRRNGSTPKAHSLAPWEAAFTNPQAAFQGHRSPAAAGKVDHYLGIRWIKETLPLTSGAHGHIARHCELFTPPWAGRAAVGMAAPPWAASAAVPYPRFYWSLSAASSATNRNHSDTDRLLRSAASISFQRSA